MRLHLCTLFSRYLRGLDDKETPTWQRKDGVEGLHSTRTLLGYGLEREVLIDINSLHGFSCIWHDTLGEYFECTRKLTTNKSNTTNNNKAFYRLMNEHEHDTIIHDVQVDYYHGPSDQLTNHHQHLTIVIITRSHQ